MTDTKDLLRAVGLFADLPDDDLDRVCEGAYEENVPAGEDVFVEGDEGDRACVIVAGEVEVTKAAGTRQVLLAVRGPGEVVGEMSLLDSAPRMATVTAKVDTSLLFIPKAQMDELLATSATAARSLFGVLLERWRETEGRLRQSERMAQIGTLTAGLAHEMNNPAAAVIRGAGQLDAAVRRLGSAMAGLEAAGVPADEGSVAAEVLAASGARGEPLSALEASDREAAFEDALDALGIAEGWRLAPELTATGLEPEKVAAAAAQMSPAAAAALVEAMAATADASSLVREVEEGASRLSAIVGALKSYSHLDRADVQEIDLHRGLDDTLLILKRKLDGIEIRREYTPGELRIEAYAGELNQVWTNLIDNAADAIAESGRPDGVITLRTGPGPDGGAVVEVEDNGPGIPADVVNRVFDAFFTTKPPGSGTGLGLDISYGIVVDRHRGELTVDSERDRTTFRVVLPGRVEG